MLALTVYAIVNWVSALIFLAFTVILWTASKLPSTRIYAGISVSMALWAIGVALMMSDPGGFEGWVLFFSRFNYYVGGFAGPLFLYFSYVYPEEVRFKKSAVVTFVALELLLIYPFFFTDGIISTAYVTHSPNFDLGWTHGKAVSLFYATFLLPFLGGIALLLKKYLEYKDTEIGRKIGYLLWASTFGSILSLTANVALPFFAIFTYSWLGPVFTIIWVAITSYTIQKYGSLKLRTVASILAILALIIILFINIFLP